MYLLVIIYTTKMDHVSDYPLHNNVFQVTCAVFIETELAGNF